MCESFRLKSKMTPENQPEGMRYQTSRPVAAVAKAETATSHSHITAAGLRDDCNMERRWALGWKLEIRTGDPDFRLTRKVLM